MRTHELDRDRETTRYSVEALGVDYAAFAFLPVVQGHPKDIEGISLDDCNVFVLLTAQTMTPLVVAEFHRARMLGMPRRVFARVGEPRSEELIQFLATCGCQIFEYTPDTLSRSLSEYFASLRATESVQQAVSVHTVDLWSNIIRDLARRPESVFQLSPRKFEELVARLIAAHGYETTLTSQTRDGGYDILAKRVADPLFPTVHLVEAKLWLPPRKVGAPVIRGVYGVGIASHCNGVMVVTPSSFTRDAVAFLEQGGLQHYVRLVDGDELPAFYRQYLRQQFGMGDNG
jgi:hypothetical protein